MKEQNQNTPEVTPEVTPEKIKNGKKEQVYTSIFDKPNHQDEKPQKIQKGSRKVRNVIVCLVLCAALGLGAFGVFRFVDFGDDATGDDTSSAVSEEEKLIFDYSYYGDATEDTDTMALGGIKTITVANANDTYDLQSHWGKEVTIDETTYEESEVDALRWLITSVKDKDTEGVVFSESTVDFIVSDLLKIAYNDIYAQDGTAEIPAGGQTYLEECGLDDSNIRSTVTFENGASFTVVVGDQTPTGNGYFLTVQSSAGSNPNAAGTPKEDKAIYTVGADTVAYLMKEAVYFVEKDFLPYVEQDETVYDEFGDSTEDPYFITGELSRFDALSISGANYPKDFVFQMVEATTPGNDSIYKMTSPYTQNVDMDAMDALLLPMNEGLSASENLVMKATAADLEEYGLKNPACAVHYTIKDRDEVLYIGKQVDKETDCYAVMLKGNPSIFSVAASYLVFQTYDEADFASTTVYTCDITEIKTFTVALEDGTKTQFHLTHGTDDDGNQTLAVTDGDGNTVPTEPFRQMYMNFLGLTSFEKVTDGKDAATPYVTISITYNKYSQTDVLRLSPYTDRRYYLSLNGSGSTVVLSTVVDTFVDSYNALV